MKSSDFSSWYRTDRIDPGRLDRFLRPCTFDEVLRRVVSEFSAPSYKGDRGKREAKGYWRAVFSFSVTTATYDAFFNGPAGYRAQFCEHSCNGSVKNRECIDALTPLLLDFVRLAAPKDPVEKITVSLRCKTAKIWIDEQARDCTLNHQTITVDDLVVLNVPRWVQAAREAEQAMQSTRPKAKQCAMYGVQAPEGTRLKVLGGFINESTTANLSYRRSDAGISTFSCTAFHRIVPLKRVEAIRASDSWPYRSNTD